MFSFRMPRELGLAVSGTSVKSEQREKLRTKANLKPQVYIKYLILGVQYNRVEEGSSVSRRLRGNGIAGLVGESLSEPEDQRNPGTRDGDEIGFI